MVAVQDLLFPHHENEIAQSEAATGEQYVNYWMHVGFINVDGEKCRSLWAIFFTIRDVMDKFHPEVIRYFIEVFTLSQPSEFFRCGIKEAKSALSRFYHAFKAYRKQQYAEPTTQNLDQALVSRFTAAMSDDFNTSEALAVLFEIIKELNRAIKEQQAEQAQLYYSTLRYLVDILGLVQHDVDEFLNQILAKLNLT